MEETILKARYTICTIITNDIELAKEAKRLNEIGYKHELIYRTGIDAIKAKEVNK